MDSGFVGNDENEIAQSQLVQQYQDQYENAIMNLKTNHYG